MNTLKFELTSEEYKLLGTALVELPYWKVAALIAKLDAAVQAQLPKPKKNQTQVLNESTS